ncbi:MAG: threonine/serine dehydratase [Deltaproteobacteria bacterium]|nr:threonine/serine dehydratase [Candidatus Zymogenaceae bacterium]
MITFADIRDAHTRIKNFINRTPIMTSRTIDEMCDASLFFKCENLQRAGAFKARGAMNTLSLLTDEEKNRGVVTHSSGNHAQALALASRMVGVRATIVMPKSAPRVKVEATRGYDAEVVFCDDTEADRIATTESLIESHGYTMVHPYDDDRIICGAATAAWELLEDIGGIDVIVAPVGGGGLLSGTSLAAKLSDERIRVYAVEPKGADDAYRSYRKGEIVKNDRVATIADGLRTSLSPRTFSIIREHVDGIITVSDREIIEAMRLLWERMKIVVEPSGAVPLAGILKNDIQIAKKRVGVILSGGNIDLGGFFEMLDKKIMDGS